MEWSDFLSLVRDGDGDGVDTKFFGSFISEDKLGPILVAMANTRGGNIVIGFDKRNYHLLGTYVDESFIETLIDDYCYPKPDFSFDICSKNDKRIAIIHIKASPLKPYYFNNKCYVLNPERSSLSILEKDVLQDDRTYSFNRISEKSLLSDDNGADSPVSAPVMNGDFVTDEQSIEHLQDLNDITEELVQLHDTTDVDTNSSLDHKDNDHIVVDQDEENTNSEEQLSMSQFELRPLTKRQEEALDYLDKNKFIKNKMYRSLFSVSHKRAHLELVDLVQRQLIVSQGSGRSTCYVIDETCKKVSDLVRH